MDARSPFAPALDLLVAGGGIAGLALALAVKRAYPPARVAVSDPSLAKPAPAGRANFRAVAVAAGSRLFLDGLGAWRAVADDAQPILDMAITDSRPADAPRPVFLGFSGRVGPDDAPFAHMAFADDLRRVLRQACGASGVVLDGRTVTGFEGHGAAARAETDGGDFRARLVVAADGGRSQLRGLAGIRTVAWDYGQSAVVATLAHTRSHEGRATQHFLPAGPIALLPLRADDGSPRRFSLVWTEATAEAGRLAALPPDAFVEALEARIGFEYGTLRLEDRPSAHALRLVLPRRLVGPRFALAGDAARTIHPLAGQGLNLGLRDAAVLAAAVAAHLRLGLDPGDVTLLRGYERARRFDAVAMAVATDGLNRLFSNDALPVRLLRDLGLGLVDRMPGLKHALIQDAAGLPGGARRG